MATAHRRRLLLEDAALGALRGQFGAVVVCQSSVVSLLGSCGGLLGLGQRRSRYMGFLQRRGRHRCCPIPRNWLACSCVLGGELLCLPTERRPLIQDERAGVPSPEAATG